MRTARDPCTERCALLVGHAGQVPDRHGLRGDGLLPDFLRIRADALRRIEQEILRGDGESDLRRLLGVAAGAARMDDRLHDRELRRRLRLGCARRNRDRQHERPERGRDRNRPNRPAGVPQVEEVADVRGKQRNRQQHEPGVRMNSTGSVK